MSEEEDEVIKLKENVVTRINEQRLTRNVLGVDLIIFRRFQFWKSFLFGAGGGKQVVLSCSLFSLRKEQHLNSKGPHSMTQKITDFATSLALSVP